MIHYCAISWIISQVPIFHLIYFINNYFIVFFLIRIWYLVMSFLYWNHSNDPPLLGIIQNKIPYKGHITFPVSTCFSPSAPYSLPASLPCAHWPLQWSSDLTNMLLLDGLGTCFSNCLNVLTKVSIFQLLNSFRSF